MTKNKAILIAAAFFPNYPAVNKFHVTSDEQVFIEADAARMHAEFLDKKEPVVFEVDRADVTQEGAKEENPVIIKKPAKARK